MRKVLLHIIFFVFIVGCLGQFFGKNFDLYSQYTFYDNAMHFLGGFGAALSFSWICLVVLKNPSALCLYAVSITASIVAGIGWEYFQVIHNLNEPGQLDTVTDLLFDLIGGVTAFLFVATTH